MSNFIGNIDHYSTKHDIYDYMKANTVTPTLINVFYLRNGAAAKVNIHADDQQKIDNDYFCPNAIIVRKWVSKEGGKKKDPEPTDDASDTSIGITTIHIIEHTTHPMSARPATARTPISTDTDQGATDARSYHDNNSDYSRDDRNSDDEWDPESRYQYCTTDLRQTFHLKLCIMHILAHNSFHILIVFMLLNILCWNVRGIMLSAYSYSNVLDNKH